MSDERYDVIRKIWEKEVRTPDLQDLDDFTVGQMGEYLVEVRLALTEVPAENVIQAELYTREIENIEYMLKDLLMLRREKILRAVTEGQELRGSMTLAEEEFYNRISRGVNGHLEFVEAALTGKTPEPQGDTASSEVGLDEEEVEYITVRFTRSIDTPFLGLDEQTYGPFKKEDIATIPVDNVRPWLRDGTVIRVVIEEPEEE